VLEHWKNKLYLIISITKNSEKKNIRKEGRYAICHLSNAKNDNT